MIHELDGRFVISSGDTWLSGVYATREAANLAFRLPDLTLAQMQCRANARMPGGVGGVITEEEVRRKVSAQARAIPRKAAMPELPVYCPKHPQAHVMHQWVTHRMETRQGGYVGVEWQALHHYYCAVVGCERRLAPPEKEGHNA